MTMFAKGIRDEILDNATIAGLVGERVYNTFVPEQDSTNMPWIAFALGLPNPQNVLADNDSSDTTGWITPLTIWVCASNPDQMLGLAYLIQDIFHLYNGTIAGTTIDRILYQSYSADWADKPLSFTAMIDFEIHSWSKPNFTTT